MVSHRTFARRLLVATAASGAVSLGTGAPVNAQPPPPNCTAADLAVTMSGITAATGTYLFTHRQVNEFFTSLGDVPAEEKQGALKAYMDANPQVTAGTQRHSTARHRLRESLRNHTGLRWWGIVAPLNLCR